MPRKQISPERKGIYYFGMLLAAIGFLSLGSSAPMETKSFTGNEVEIIPQLDADHVIDLSRIKGIPVKLVLKNISKERVVLWEHGEALGITLYSIEESGRKTQLFPLPQKKGRGFGSAHREVLDPNRSCVLNINVPTALLNLKTNRVVASIRYWPSHSGKFSDDVFEAFSTPFSVLPAK
jgi:hypothetical protein